MRYYSDELYVNNSAWKWRVLSWGETKRGFLGPVSAQRGRKIRNRRWISIKFNRIGFNIAASCFSFLPKAFRPCVLVKRRIMQRCLFIYFTDKRTSCKVVVMRKVNMRESFFFLSFSFRFPPFFVCLLLSFFPFPFPSLFCPTSAVLRARKMGSVDKGREF